MELHRQPAGRETMTLQTCRAAIAAAAFAVMLSSSAEAAIVAPPATALKTSRLLLTQYANRTTVREAQQLLGRLGYSAGAADGVAGPQTRQAVQAFQRDTGLPANGAISSELLNELRSATQPASGGYGARGSASTNANIAPPGQTDTPWPTPGLSDQALLLNVTPPGFAPPPQIRTQPSYPAPSQAVQRSAPVQDFVPPPAPPAPLPRATDSSFAPPPPPPLPVAMAPLEAPAPPSMRASPSLLSPPPTMAPPLAMPGSSAIVPSPAPQLAPQAATLSAPPLLMQQPAAMPDTRPAPDLPSRTSIPTPPPPLILTQPAAPIPKAARAPFQAPPAPPPSLNQPAPLPMSAPVPPPPPIPAPTMTSQQVPLPALEPINRPPALPLASSTAPPPGSTGLLASAPGFRRDAGPTLGLSGLTGQSWRFTDDNSAEMEITFEANGKVSGPAFAEALSWTLDGGELWLLYETSLGGRSARRGRLSGPNAMSGLGESNRTGVHGQSRRWSWRAVRVR